MDLKHVSCIYRMRSQLLCAAVLLIGIPHGISPYVIIVLLIRISLGIPLSFFERNPHQTLCE